MMLMMLARLLQEGFIIPGPGSTLSTAANSDVRDHRGCLQALQALYMSQSSLSGVLERTHLPKAAAQPCNSEAHCCCEAPRPCWEAE